MTTSSKKTRPPTKTSDRAKRSREPLPMLDLRGERLLVLDIVRGPADPVAPDGYYFTIAWSPTLRVSDFVERETKGLVVSLFKKRAWRHDTFLAAKQVDDIPAGESVTTQVHQTAAFLLVECLDDWHPSN